MKDRIKAIRDRLAKLDDKLDYIKFNIMELGYDADEIKVQCSKINMIACILINGGHYDSI